MKTIKIADIKPNTHFSSPVTLDKMFLIAVPPCPITQNQLSALVKWGFKEVYGPEPKASAPQAANPNAANGLSQKQKLDLGKTESVDLSEFGVDDESSSPGPDSGQIQDIRKCGSFSF